jgi:hypothetical protein
MNPSMSQEAMKQKAEQQMETRIETDSMGEIEVPVDKYYGAQTDAALFDSL